MGRSSLHVNHLLNGPHAPMQEFDVEPSRTVREEFLSVYDKQRQVCRGRLYWLEHAHFSSSQDFVAAVVSSVPHPAP
jgi:hypothetical protein